MKKLSLLLVLLTLFLCSCLADGIFPNASQSTTETSIPYTTEITEITETTAPDNSDRKSTRLNSSHVT